MAEDTDFKPVWHIPEKANAIAQVEIEGVYYLCVEPRWMPKGDLGQAIAKVRDLLGRS
jgi:hypothetical protein